jgi:hypothetical protein
MSEKRTKSDRSVKDETVKEAQERRAHPASEAKEVATALAAPFDLSEVKWKPSAVSGNRCLAVAYVDARVVQDRLDEVLGVMGWQDRYQVLPDGSVVCRLSIRLSGEWIHKVDVGGQSEQPDEGDRVKAAFSDALKRAAVKFGVGRYLYRLDPQWVDYDPQKKKMIGTPRLPREARPATVAVEPELPAKKESPRPRVRKEAAEETKSARTMPGNGEELLGRLQGFDERLAREGLCRPGDVVKHVVSAGVAAGHDRDMTTWTGPAIQLAINEARVFETRLKQERPREVA